MDIILHRMSQEESPRWVILARGLDQATAEVLRGLLVAQDIPAILSREAAASVLPVNVGIFGLCDVLVPETHHSDAVRIARGFQSGALEDPEGKPL